MFENLIKKILNNKRHAELVWLRLPKFQFRAKCPMRAASQGRGYFAHHHFPDLSRGEDKHVVSFHKSLNLKHFNLSSCSLGFTLAEVLIVIGIIGIVAEMTIPALISDTRNQELASGVLNFATTLQQAVERWKYDNGCIGTDAATCISYIGLPDNDTTAFDGIAKYMNVAKETADYANADWLPDDTLNYYGAVESAGYGKVAKNGSRNVVYMLANGTTFSVDYTPDGYGIYVDVNGKKKPNRVGRDVFDFAVGFYSGKDIYYEPYYAISSGTNTRGLCTAGQNCDADNANPTLDNGAMPTAYVILHHKLPDYTQIAKTVSGFVP